MRLQRPLASGPWLPRKAVTTGINLMRKISVFYVIRITPITLKDIIKWIIENWEAAMLFAYSHFTELDKIPHWWIPKLMVI